MSVLSEFVHHIISTSYKKFDAATVNRAKDRVLDTLGCIISGRKAPGCSGLIDLLAECGGKKEASVIGTKLKIPVHEAALVNSVLARSFDFEPAGPLVEGKSTPAHISGTTVPTSLSVAEYVGASGKELLTALILGDDIASRIIAASKLNLDSGFESTGTVNAFGSTAIASKLLNLDEKQIANAFGIVLNRFAGTFQNIFDGAQTFKLPQGFSAQAGIFAARLAAEGYTGIDDPFFSTYGYFSLYCKESDRDILTYSLGKTFYSDNTYKPYPCCRSNHAAIDCILELHRDDEIIVEEIKAITLAIPQKAKDFAIGQPFEIRQTPQIDALFSIQYAVANALIRKEVKLEHYTEPFIKDDQVQELIHRIKIVADMPEELPLGAEVHILMKNGKELKKRIEMPKGNESYTPLKKEEKTDKFIQNLKFSDVSGETGEKAIKMIHNLEKLENTKKIAELFNPLPY